VTSAWRIELTPRSAKALAKLDRTAAARLIATMERGLEQYGDPRAFGEAMVGNWTGFWRYRARDYRAICRLEDERITVVVIEVAHRREVYR
jgi:mRNA interferase RelE/StbE